MSGGVDSSVAAALLLEAGYEVEGVFFSHRLADAEAQAGSATSPRLGSHHADDAEAVARKLGINLTVLDLTDDFEKLVRQFADEYAHGRTPNPCVICNRRIKFRRLLEFARSAGAQFAATGHHARILQENGAYMLARGADRQKDQSYFLFALRREDLARILFPVGDMTKSQVRRYAASLALPVHDKTDSMEICFVPAGDYTSVIRRYRPDALQSGPVTDLAGRVLGEHPGIANFTIGQRRGLRIALGKPAYVVEIRAETNTVAIGPKEALLRRGLVAGPTNWLVDVKNWPIRCEAQIRHQHTAAQCTAWTSADGKLCVLFDEPQSAITPGQAVVLYRNDVVLGGGWIEKACHPDELPDRPE